MICRAPGAMQAAENGRTASRPKCAHFANCLLRRDLRKSLPRMKTLLLCSLLVLSAAACYADIQDPPANDYGPTRKLGRALANMNPIIAATEIPDSIAMINEREGNASAVTYGVLKGFGRYFFRMGAGWYEFVTFPFPTYKGSYRPFYRANIPWIHGGYQEFPPELGFQTRYHYVQQNGSY